MTNCKELQKIDNRKISIITNFGCRANCWYCIWKGHKLENVRPETDWNKLEQFLEEYKYKGKVSLSGGGDCLYKYEENKEWWNHFLKIVNNKNLNRDNRMKKCILTSLFIMFVFTTNISYSQEENKSELSKIEFTKPWGISNPRFPIGIAFLVYYTDGTFDVINISSTYGDILELLCYTEEYDMLVKKYYK